ncbi:MAG: Ig-like domain-containing protein, partial [Thermoplasmata archaeon]
GDALRYSVYLSEEAFTSGSLPSPRTTTALTSYGPLNLQPGATYYWTVVASDGRESSAVPGPWRFTILSPGQNTAPEVQLLSPTDGSIINTTNVTLSWSGTDPDGDRLTFSLFLCSTIFDALSLPPPFVTLWNNSYMVMGLENGTTWWWTVTASDGLASSAVPGVRSFSVDVSLGNHPPEFTSAPPLSAAAGSIYKYRPMAIDRDGDALTFSLIAGPEGMAIDRSTGELSWTPRPRQKGENAVVIRVMDSKGGYAEQFFVINVSVRLLRCEILYPGDNETVRGVITVRGRAASGVAVVWRVEVRVDGGEWSVAEGIESWSYRLDTRNLKNGPHRLEARALEPELESQPVFVDFIVRNSVTNGTASGAPLWPSVLAAILIGAGAALALWGFRRKRER